MKKGEVTTKNILKRILSLFIINVMILSLFAPYSKVFASPTYDINVTLSSDAINLTANQEIEVKIIISGTERLAALEGIVESNSGVFQILNVETSLPGWTADIDTSNYISIYRVSGTRYANNEEIGTIKLRVLNTVSSANIKLTGIYMVNEDNDEIEDEPDVELTIPTNTITSPVPTTHTVTYDYATNGGTSTTATTPATVAEGYQIDLTPTATKDTDYEFVGWNTNANAETPLQSTDSEATMGTSDVTLYAIYRKPVVATFNYYDGDPMQKTVTRYLYNNQVTVGMIVPNTGVENTGIWDEIGWTESTSPNPTESNIIASGSSISLSQDKTYYMLYKKDINVTYNSNGGSNLAVSSIPGLYVAVNSYNILDRYSTSILPVRITTEKPIRHGYKFVKWNTMPNGRGTDYLSGQQNAHFSEDTVLYAIWEEETQQEQEEKPYLRSEAYKIGTEKLQDVDEYENGDTYISRVMFKTTIKAFLLNLSTNYTNKEVYDLQDNKITDYYQYVGTGMKIKLTREGWEDIELYIAVVGDSDGDGEVTAADLADSIQCTLDAITLNDIQYIALDIDEDGEITAEDLADEIQFTLK